MGNGVYLSRSQTSSEDSTARKKFTISGWYKLGSNGDAGGWKGFWAAATDGNNYSSLKQNADGYIIFEQKSSGTGVTWTSSGIYRDYSSWYHIMVAYDSTQASNTDRVKVYINGSIASGTHGSFTQDQEGFWGNSASTAGVGRYNNNTGSSYMYTGYMTHVVCTIGYALAPTVFGETDSTTGEWKPRTSPSGITYSANGFYLKFENSGAMGTDSSGNNNTFTVNNTGGTDGELVQTTDTPSNTFCTINPLQNGYPPTYLVTVQKGALEAKETSSNWIPYDSTMGVQSGKWYWELKNVSGSPATGVMFGIQAQEGGDITGLFTTDNRYPGYYSGRVGFSYHASGTYYYNGASTTTGSVSYTTGDIIMLALDMDNGYLYAGKNGSWNNSGVPTSGSSGTGNVYSGFSGKTITPCNALNGSSLIVGLNFGNPQFTIASSNSDAAGFGSFEYAVPSGYYALCTENLNTYG